MADFDFTSDAPPAGSRLFVTGTFNEWEPCHPASELSAFGDRTWEGRLQLNQGIHAVRFVTQSGESWGELGESAVIPPTEGLLQRDGSNLLLNVLETGRYSVHVNGVEGTWMVLPRRIGRGPSGALQRANLDGGREFVAALRQGESRWKAWLQFAQRNGELPFLEGNEVHFIWVRAANATTPAFVTGSFNEWDLERDAMARVGRSPVWHLSLKLPPLARHTYKFYSAGEWCPDPHNVLVAWDGFATPHYGFNSQVVCGADDDPFTLRLLNFYSLFLDRSVAPFIYLPPGYRSTPDRCPVLYLVGGEAWLAGGTVERHLSHLVRDGQIRKVILVIDPSSPDPLVLDAVEQARYGRFLTRELVPYVDNHFHTDARPVCRGIMGDRAAENLALRTAMQYPLTFGKTSISQTQLGNLSLSDVTSGHLTLHLSGGSRLAVWMGESQGWKNGDFHRHTLLTALLRFWPGDRATK